ncbi:MAG: acyl-CoA dehydratase activase [Gemmiger sp.]|uniref:acyl-CoA dehydratase activase n=1 Tax=Gemmiger sp. TaxID=2049027 RepID=UPI002E7812D8|nr:acyl-CoA dehydratase activase [Gemmiger sp.]MEE0800008.1 acyl-CoA dehydratase activase [Gemmiger sp.]
MKTLYYSCKYAPLELIAGYGLEFSALDPLAESFSCAERCAHANLCGYAKAVLEQIEQSDIRALVLTDCCDAMRRVYDVLKAGGKMEFLYLLPVPHQSDEIAQARLTRDLAKFAEALHQATGRDFDPARAESFFTQAEKVSGPHLTLLGAHGGSVLADTVRKAFSLPVEDGTCTGNRSVKTVKAAALEEFLPAYAAALLGQTPCMRMHVPAEARASLVDKDTVGILYHTMQFCDYYAPGFTSPESYGVPVLKFETDCTRQTYTGGSGQLRTRLGAFAESLHAVPNQNEGGIQVNPEAEYVAGIDSGSSSTDAVILDRAGHICGSAIVPTGAGAATGARKALEQALAEARIPESALGARVYTGYGREFLGQDGSAVTEITCHARGAHFLDPGIRTVIDIGGQDSKVIRLGEDGTVEGFIMNDKCAAGTGRFLEMMARTLQMPIDQMSELGLSWKRDVTISSMCTVFAESEVVSLIARSTAPADIIHGLNKSVATKTASLVRRAGGGPRYMMTGGVARNRGVVEELEKAIGASVAVSEYSQLCGSLGAALFALDKIGGLQR